MTMMTMEDMGLLAGRRYLIRSHARVGEGILASADYLPVSFEVTAGSNLAPQLMEGACAAACAASFDRFCDRLEKRT